MKINKIISIILAAAMLAGLVTVSAAATTDENILYFEDFTGDSELDSAVWAYANHGNVSNGELLVATGKYPRLSLPDMEASKSYELSYKVKFEQAGGAWKVYNEIANAYLNFGCAVPGTGFSWEYNEPKDGICTNEADVNKWYTVKVEFCADPTNRYTKNTLLNEEGELVDYRVRSDLYNGAGIPAAIPTDTAVTVKPIYFWNDKNAGNIYVDDITLKEVRHNGEIFAETFSGTRDAKVWVNNDHGTIENGSMTIEHGKYPYLKLPSALNTSDAFKISYKIKGTSASADTDAGKIFKPYVEKGGGNLVSYRPGYGFSVAANNWDEDFGVTGDEFKKLDTWYIAETEFCQSDSNGYVKWTIKNEAGEVLHTKEFAGGYKEFEGGEGYVTENLAGTNICLWNSMSDASVVIDDFTISKVAESDNPVLFNDDFSADTINTDIWESHGETVADGAMLISNGDWPTLKMPALSADNTYRFSYKVMAPTANGEKDSDLLKVMHSDAAGNGRSFGSYRPGYGFVFNSLNWGEPNFAYTQTGVWYTVETMFCEKEGSQFTKWTVKDEDGKVLFSNRVDSLWNANASVATTASVSGAKIWFYNNSSSALDIYVDDVKLEKATPVLYIDVDTDINATDYSGKTAKLTDGITPALEKISMKFSDEVTKEAAEANIMLKEKDGEAVVSEFSIDGKTVIMTLSELLVSGATYELVIEDTLKTENGVAVEGPVTIEFVAGAANDAVAKINTLPVKNLGELTAGGSIEVSAVVANPTNSDKNAVMIVAFYDGTLMVNAQLSEVKTVNPGKVETVPITVSVPQDITNITAMKVFMWHNLTGIAPYAEFEEVLPAS